MKKYLFIFLMMLSVVACSDDNNDNIWYETFQEPVGSNKKEVTVKQSVSRSRNSNLMNEDSVSVQASMPVLVWNTDVQIATSRNLKISFDQRYFPLYISPGIYVCKMYTITAVTNVNPKMVYFSVDDDECGFKPTATSKDPIVRGTRVYDNGNGTYTLKTICYKIISDIQGITPSGDGYLPCDPYKALLKYKCYEIPDLSIVSE